MENPMKSFEAEVSGYESVKKTFGNLLDSKEATLSKKVQALEELADSIGTNEKNSRDFEELLIRLKFQNSELYEAYQGEIKEAA